MVIRAVGALLREPSPFLGQNVLSAQHGQRQARCRRDETGAALGRAARERAHPVDSGRRACESAIAWQRAVRMGEGGGGGEAEATVDSASLAGGASIEPGGEFQRGASGRRGRCPRNDAVLAQDCPALHHHADHTTADYLRFPAALVKIAVCLRRFLWTAWPPPLPARRRLASSLCPFLVPARASPNHRLMSRWASLLCPTHHLLLLCSTQ